MLSVFRLCPTTCHDDVIRVPHEPSGKVAGVYGMEYGALRALPVFDACGL
jgi:hypothetical protein